MNTHQQYPTNVTEAQWQLLIPLLPKRKWRKGSRGRPPVNLRNVFDGILYLTKTGCQWRMLPHTFGCWQTVYGYFNKWQKQEVFERVQQALSRKERKRQGRKATASAGCVDSQSVKTATQGESCMLRCWQKGQWTQTPPACRYPRTGDQRIRIACQSPRS